MDQGFLKVYIGIYACRYNNFVYISIIVLPFDIKIPVISNTSTALILSLILEIFFRGTVEFASLC